MREEKDLCVFGVLCFHVTPCHTPLVCRSICVSATGKCDWNHSFGLCVRELATWVSVHISLHCTIINVCNGHRLPGRAAWKESWEPFSSSSVVWLCYCVYARGVCTCVHVCFFTFLLLSILSQPFTHMHTNALSSSSCLFPCSVCSIIQCLITPSLSSSPDTGAVSGCRCVAGVQAAGSSHPQVDGVALQPLQGGVGLAHPAAGHLHRHPDSLLSRIPPQRSRGFSSKDRIIKVHLGFCLKVMFTLKMTLALNDKDQRMCKCSRSRLQTPPNSFTRLACVAAVAVQ